MHSNPRVQQTWDEYGEAAFRFLIVERIASKEALRARELWWLTEGETWEPERGFNISRRSDTVGFTFTPEQRARVSAGTKRHVRTPEHRAALSKAMKNRVDLEQARERMAALGRSGKGRRKTKAHRRKIGLPQRGSGNHRAKLTEADVIEIHWHLAIGEKSKAEIGLMYGIAYGTVYGIETGKSWAHLKPKY